MCKMSVSKAFTVVVAILLMSKYLRAKCIVYMKYINKEGKRVKLFFANLFLEFSRCSVREKILDYE